MTFYTENGPSNSTFEAILYSSGSIEFRYSKISPYAYGAIGIENYDSTDYFLPTNCASNTVAGSIYFKYNVTKGCFVFACYLISAHRLRQQCL